MVIMDKPASDTRFHIFTVASQLMSERGFEQVNVEDITSKAGVSSSDFYRYFGNKEDVVFYLYRSINTDWESATTMLMPGKLPERFEAAIASKLQLIAPYKTLLQKLLPLLLNDNNLNVFSNENKVIRKQGSAIMEHVVNGSRGLVLSSKKKTELANTLYLMHWGVMFIALHEENNTKALAILKMFRAWLGELNMAKQVMLPFLLPKITQLSDTILEEDTTSETLAKTIIDVVFTRRKLIPGSTCEKKYCAQCYGLHLPKVQYFIDNDKPIHIILPAFPAKSPNLSKVLGKLPDLGEEIALLALQGICDDIKRVYKHGAHITICADGRIFADLVQVTDEDVTAYTSTLHELIQELDAKDISIINLEDVIVGKDFEAIRQYVIQHYAQPADELKEKIKHNSGYNKLFNGMHRFITEDRLFTEEGRSKTKIKEESKDIAISVIQRSNAWTKLLAYFYPDALRLSIHPQEAHSEKIGIKLTRSSDEWITPWHGVVVLHNEDYTLMKRSEAEDKGATLVYKDSNPSHYKLTS